MVLVAEFQLNNEKLNLLLVHGSPRKINEYLFEDRDEKSLLRIMEHAEADIMCFGHTHKLIIEYCLQRRARISTTVMRSILVQ